MLNPKKRHNKPKNQPHTLLLHPRLLKKKSLNPNQKITQTGSVPFIKAVKEPSIKAINLVSKVKNLPIKVVKGLNTKVTDLAFRDKDRLIRETVHVFKVKNPHSEMGKNLLLKENLLARGAKENLSIKIKTDKNKVYHQDNPLKDNLLLRICRVADVPEQVLRKDWTKEKTLDNSENRKKNEKNKNA